jgi:hypothetical protein
MHPPNFLTRPIRDLTGAIVMPFKAIFVVGLCAAINWMSFHGTWWVKWVALGMGIAVLVALARAARTLLLLAVVGWVGWKIYQRHGAAARQRFDDWVRGAQPATAQVLDALRGPWAGDGAPG